MTRFVVQLAAIAAVPLLLALSLIVGVASAGCGASAPAEAAIERGPAPEAGSTPTTAPAAQATGASASVSRDVAQAQAGITQNPGPMANSLPPAGPAAQITTAPGSVSEDGILAQVAAIAQAAVTQVTITRGAVAKSDTGPSTGLVSLDTTGLASSPQPQDGGRVETVPDSKPKGAPGTAGSTQGQTYTWEDGDRTLTARLQTDLVVQKDADGSSGDIVAANAGGGSIVKNEDGYDKSDPDSQPVFRSESGALMTLPGGVLLALDPDWTKEETDAFFSGNNISLDRVSELSYITNGFFVETEPGFPSLNLANALAAQEGVEVSSPNWWTEVTTK